MPETFRPTKDRRKTAPVKRVVVSSEARQAYEDTMRERDQRARDHTQHLPEEHRGKR